MKFESKTTSFVSKCLDVTIIKFLFNNFVFNFSYTSARCAGAEVRRRVRCDHGYFNVKLQFAFLVERLSTIIQVNPEENKQK